MDEDANKDYSVSKMYEDEEFPSSYQNFLVEKYKLQELFASECLHKIFQSGQISGTKLLDFGCGPTIHRITSASLKFNEITLAEYSEVNRKEVEKWLKDDKDALDWKPLLEQCARVEGYRDLEKGVKEIELRIRNSVKKVVSCDALSKHVLPAGLGEFDAISTFYCLEDCCFTVKRYKEAVQKLTEHLKKGGVMVFSSVLRCGGFYAHKYIPEFILTEEIIKESLDEAGLELQDWFRWKDTFKYKLFSSDGTAFYYGTKR